MVVQLENSVEAVTSVFGALKAGAVFVVVNPQRKADKLAFMLNDCRAAAIVTDASRGEALAASLTRPPASAPTCRRPDGPCIAGRRRAAR